MTSTEAAPRNSVSSPRSIVTHPWFPKVIGLWFAALLGLCSLAVASDVLERVVTTLGIDRIVPAAAPPLGQTARLLLAMAMAGVGEIIGLVIGGQLASRHRARAQRSAAGSESVPQPRSRDRHPDAPPRKPLSATDDLSGIDRALRRRALISETDHEPRPFFESAPLPGTDPTPTETIASLAEAPATLAAPSFIDPSASEILDLETCGTRIDREESLDARPFAAPEPALDSHEPQALEVTGASEAAIAEPVVPSQPTPVVDVAAASLDSLGIVHLSERLALALQARRERHARLLATAKQAAPEAPFAFAAPPQLEAPARLPGRLAPLVDALDDDEPHDIPALARSLALPAELVAPTDEALTDAAEYEPEAIAPELSRGLEILARRAAKPTAETTPVERGADDGDDAEPDDLADEASEASEAEYSSLLAMGASSARPYPVRIDEPRSDEIEPVVIFPGQGGRAAGPFAPPATAPFAAPFGQPGATGAPDHAVPAAPDHAVPAARTPAAGTMPPADPEETERALRAALASLQRISGAR